MAIWEWSKQDDDFKAISATVTMFYFLMLGLQIYYSFFNGVLAENPIRVFTISTLAFVLWDLLLTIILKSEVTK